MTYITAFIAFIVAVIALFQWDTARQKVVLDLFDKRFEVYDLLRLIVSRHITTGISTDDVRQFEKTLNRASFLFGREVIKYLECVGQNVTQSYIDESRLSRIPPNLSREDIDAITSRTEARFNSFREFPSRFDALVAPYMKHTQKQSPCLVRRQPD